MSKSDPINANEDNFRDRAIKAFNVLSRPSNKTEEECDGSQPIDMEMTTMAAAALLASMCSVAHPSPAKQRLFMATVVKVAHDMLVSSWGGDTNAPEKADPDATLN